MAKTNIPADFYATGGQVLGSVATAIDDPQDGKSSVGGQALSMGGTGAAMGMSVGGPLGAAVGGALGAGVGAITASVKNKKIQEELDREEAYNRALKGTATMRPMINTQAPIYKDGTPGATISHLAEVEKDELVMRKDHNGKFQLVADFKNGKSHTQGGEDVVLGDGDIVFPGKMRKKVMSMLKSGDNPGLESARLSLPKDIPADGELQNGYSGQVLGQSLYDNPPSGIYTKEEQERIEKYKAKRARVRDARSAVRDAVDAYYKGAYYPYNEKTEMEAYNILGDEYTFQPNRTKLPKSSKPFTYGIPNYLDEYSQKENPYIGGELPEVSITPTSSKVTGPSRSAMSEGMPAIKQEAYNTTANQVPTYNTDINATIREDARGTKEAIDFFSENTFDERIDLLTNVRGNIPEDITVTDDIPDIELEDDAAVKLDNKLDPNWGAVSNYAPALMDFANSLRTPERVKRRTINPILDTYTDMSEGDRAQIRRSERLARLDADRTSGGSSQVARARKELASGQAIDRLGQVSSREAQRADMVNSRNVQTLNRAQAMNINLENQYDDLDARNRAAVDNLRSRATDKAYQAARVNMADASAEERNRWMMRLLETSDYKAENGKIVLKDSKKVDPLKKGIDGTK